MSNDTFMSVSTYPHIRDPEILENTGPGGGLDVTPSRQQNGVTASRGSRHLATCPHSPRMDAGPCAWTEPALKPSDTPHESSELVNLKFQNQLLFRCSLKYYVHVFFIFYFFNRITCGRKLVCERHTHTHTVYSFPIHSLPLVMTTSFILNN